MGIRGVRAWARYLKQAEVLADAAVWPRLLLPGKLVQRLKVWNGFPRGKEGQEVGGKKLGHSVLSHQQFKEGTTLPAENKQNDL